MREKKSLDMRIKAIISAPIRLPPGVESYLPREVVRREPPKRMPAPIQGVWIGSGYPGDIPPCE